MQTLPAGDVLLREIVGRCRAVYTMPAVAAEVVELTDNPKVDVAALKECIERDAGLTAKLLRVANSPYFSLRGEVSDLNQALALLGVKPLKLLVLGFSLPERLFRTARKEHLEWYWRTTLARTAAAREVDALVGAKCGETAFLAALLQDIGVLVMIDQLGEPYCRVLNRVINYPLELAEAEAQSLGINHRELSAELLRGWCLPQEITEAIGCPRSVEELKHRGADGGVTARVLYLADQLAKLLAQRRIGALPGVVEAGQAFFQLEKADLKACITSLQEKIDQLAKALSLDGIALDLSEIVEEAHRQMSGISEEVAVSMSLTAGAGPVEEVEENLLQEVHGLRHAVGRLVAPKKEAAPAVAVKEEPEAASSEEYMPVVEIGDLQTRLSSLVGRCRLKRVGLSVIEAQVRLEGGDDALRSLLAELLVQFCRRQDNDDAVVEALPSGRVVMILPGCERREAVSQAMEIGRNLRAMSKRLKVDVDGAAYQLRVGVSAVLMPSKNFPSEDLLAAAQRCLEATPQAGGDAVKSIELF